MSERKIKSKQVHVGGLTYDIVEHSGWVVSDEAQVRFAEISTRDGVIKYADCMKSDTLHQSVVHEITHAIDYEYQLGLDEEATTRLSNGLYAFLVANPELVRELIGD